MLYWLTFAASLLTLCTALPSPLAEPQNRRTTYTSRRYSQDPVRAEVAGILTTFAPGSDQRDYIFIFNGYDSNDRLIRQNGCYHDTQRNNPVVYCLDAQAYDGGTIVTDPRRGEAAFASIRRFRDFMFSYEDDVAPRYRTPQFETRTMRPTILTDIRPGKYLDFDFRVELLNGAFSKSIRVTSSEWIQHWHQSSAATEFLWNPRDKSVKNLELHPWFKNREGPGNQ